MMVLFNQRIGLNIAIGYNQATNQNSAFDINNLKHIYFQSGVCFTY